MKDESAASRNTASAPATAVAHVRGNTVFCGACHKGMIGDGELHQYVAQCANRECDRYGVKYSVEWPTANLLKVVK